jgi:hypothetical protein
MNGIHSDGCSLLRQLTAMGVDSFYASYWVAYRLAFISNDQVPASPFGNGTHGYVRDLRRRAIVDAKPNPAFLLCCDDREDLESYLAVHPVRHEAVDVGGFRLYRGFPPEFLAKLRQAHAIPFAIRPDELSWGAPRGPARVTAGSVREWLVEFASTRRRSDGTPLPFPPNIHVSYHWERPSGEVVAVDGLRAGLPPQRTWERTNGYSIRARVLANVPPGDYRLRFDLVHEGWFWLAELGTPTAVADVHVDPTAVPLTLEKRQR